MYLTFPTRYQVHIHDDKTGRVISSCTIPEPIEQGYFQGQDQFIIYGPKRLFIYKKNPGSYSFQLMQTRLKNI